MAEGGGRLGPNLGGLADRGHVEVRHPERGHGGPVEVFAELAPHRPFGPADLRDPAQHLDRRLIEPEVVHRTRHLAVLDEIDAVARETGQ